MLIKVDKDVSGALESEETMPQCNCVAIAVLIGSRMIHETNNFAVDFFCFQS